MTLKERLKQLKTDADERAVQYGYQDATTAAKAVGRDAGQFLGAVTKVAGKVVSAMLEASVEADRAAKPTGEWKDGPDGYGYYKPGPCGEYRDFS